MALTAVVGVTCGWLSLQSGSPMIFAAGLLATTAFVLVSYWVHFRAQDKPPGMTTEVATLVVFLLGGLVAWGQSGIAVALGILTTALLAWKEVLHRAVGGLDKGELLGGIKLLAATFIVLPLLPSEPVDPWNALSPYKLWLLVILISTISLVGYVAVRWLGARRGNALTGFFGGLVSSTAVALTFAKTSKQNERMADTLAAGVLLSWLVMFVRVLIEVAVVDRQLLPPLIAPMSAMGVVCAVGAFWAYRRGRNEPETAPVEAADDVSLRNPFALGAAIKFGLIFAAVLLIAKLVQVYLPQQGLYAVAALAGTTDVDAITLSLAELSSAGDIDAHIAIRSIVIAALTNTAVKCGLVISLGSRALARRAGVATAALLTVAAVVLAVQAFAG